MQKIWAETALTREGWQHDVLVSVDSSGVITSVEAGSQADAERTCVLLPAPSICTATPSNGPWPG
jgi:hypothetical protein